jgi:hypothetical protein
MPSLITKKKYEGIEICNICDMNGKNYFCLKWERSREEEDVW